MRPLGSWSTRQYCWCIFAVGLLIRLVLLLSMHMAEDRISYEPVRIAQTLVTRGEYADPYATMRTGPTAHNSPGYPLYLALLFSLFGIDTGTTVSYYLNVVLACAQYALLPFWASLLQVPPVWGFIGGLIGAAVPFNFLSEAKSGESLSGLAFLLMVILTLQAARKESFTLGKGLLHGVLWGITLMIGSSSLLLLIPVLLVIAWQMRHKLQPLIVYSVALAIGAGVAMSPWVIRNQRVLGAPIVFRSNMGAALALSYNDDAAVTYYGAEKNGSFEKYYPNVNIAEATRSRDLGEVEYQRRKKEEAVEWMSRHPVKTVELSVLRGICFWFPVTPVRTQWPLIWGLSLLDLVGIPILWRRNRFAGQMLLAISILFPLTYWITIFTARYRLQIQFVFLLPAGAALGWVVDRWMATRQKAVAA